MTVTLAVQFSTSHLIMGLLGVASVLALLGLVVAIPPPNPDFVPSLSMDNGTADGQERWGYVDVREGAHMFWWLYRTYHVDGVANRPWVIWLQGGPGSSSCGYGNFELIGPLDVDLNEREETWVKSASILFLDQPVGTGYSYVDDPIYYTTDNLQVALDQVEWIKVFLTNYPEFQTIPLYIIGESYGGKMGAEFAYELQMAKNRGEVTVDLRGEANGNAWLSGEDAVMEWAPHLLYMSNLDNRGYNAVMTTAEACQQAIRDEDWVEATRLWGLTENVLWAHTNMVDFYHILKYVGTVGRDPTTEYFKPDSKKDIDINIDPILYNVHLAPFEQKNLDDIMNNEIRAKLGIIPPTVTWGGQGGAVFDYLEGDFMKPVIDVMDKILNETDLELIIYQGSLDLICLTKAAMNVVDKMTWPGIPAYQAVEKFAINDPAYAPIAQTEVFAKAYENFKFYWVLNAGHMVPKDYPTAARRLLERIIFDVDR